MGAVCRRPAVSGAGRVVTDVWFLYGPRRSTIRALLNSSLGEAVWTTQAGVVAPLAQRDPWRPRCQSRAMLAASLH